MPLKLKILQLCYTSLLLAFFVLPEVHSQSKKQIASGFMLQNGTDTLTIERFSRIGNKLEGRLLFKDQIPIVYRANINEQKQLEQLAIQVLKPGSPEGTPPQQESVLTFRGDSIMTVSVKGDTKEKESIKTTPGAMAYHPKMPMLSLLEQIVMRARVKGGQQVTVPVFLLSTKGQTINATINFSGNDSARVALGNTTVHLKVNKDGEILGGKTSGGQTIKRLESVPDAALATKAPDYSAPADAPYTAEQVRIQTKAGHVLAGTLTIPKNASKPVPVVVTITGSSPQDRDNNTPFGGPYHLFGQLADELGRNGIAVLRMDDRGVGQSTGNLENATSAERADDIREGIAFAKKQKRIDKDRVVLVGLSEGGMIAPMIAKTNKAMNGIVLMAGPASPGKELLEYQIRTSLEQGKNLTPEEREKAFKKALQENLKEADSNPWLRYFLNYNPLETARQIKSVPVLIMQGTTDKNVPPGDAKKLAGAFKAAGNKNVTLKMMEGYNHIFLKDENGHQQNYQNLKSFTVGPEVIQPIVDWVAKVTNVAQ